MITFEVPPAIVAPAAAEIDADWLIECLLHVEGNPWTRPGGALGYTRAAWVEDTTLPYDYAKRRDYSTAVARKRIERFVRTCTQLGLRVQPIHIADMWRRGFARALYRLWHDLPFGADDYAQRAANLYHESR